MHIQLQQFTGPLDVLLALIEEEKLDISKISLAKVADQYLAHVNAEHNLSFDQLIYFIEIASKLVLLKTRLLLPYLIVEEEETEDENLVERLKQCKHYLDTAKILEKLWYDSNSKSFNRDSAHIFKRVMSEGDTNVLLHHLSKEQLENRMREIIKNRTKTSVRFAHIKKAFNLQDKIREIQQYIQARQEILFSDLTTYGGSKSEVIINFLALLELSRTKLIYLIQKVYFEEITIQKKYDIALSS